MKSPNQQPLLERLPDPEDLHYMGAMDPFTLGSAVVRLNDFSLGRLGVNEAAEAAVEARSKAKADAGHVMYTSIYRDPSMDYSATEHAKVNKWADAHNDIQMELYEKGLHSDTLKHGLDDVRHDIRAIDLKIYGQHFDDIFDKIAPPMLKHRVDQWRSQDPRADRGGAWLYSLGDFNQESDDDFLLNFLQWHNHRIEQLQQNPEFTQGVEIAKENYLYNLRKLEKQSVVAKGSFKRARQNLKTKDIQHFVADPFYAAQIRAGAYASEEEFTSYVPGSSVGQEATELLNSLYAAADHEFNHVVLGKLPRRWLNEAVTEHLALVMADRDVHQVYAGADGNAYEAERNALDALIDAANRINGNEVLSILDFTHAYSQGHTKMKQAALGELLTELKMCFDFNVLAGISGFLLEKEEEMQNKGITDLREREKGALEAVRHVLAQEPEKLKSYIYPEAGIAA